MDVHIAGESREHAIIPSNIIEKHFGGAAVLVCGGIVCSTSVDLQIFQAGSVTSVHYCIEILLPHMRLFRGAAGPVFLLMDGNTTPYPTVAVTELLKSDDIQRMDCPSRSRDHLNLIEHAWNLLGRCMAARE